MIFRDAESQALDFNQWWAEASRAKRVSYRLKEAMNASEIKNPERFIGILGAACGYVQNHSTGDPEQLIDKLAAAIVEGL